MSITATHRPAPSPRLSVTGLAAVFAAHGLLAILLLHAEPWTPPAAERVLAVSLLSEAAPAQVQPQRPPNRPPPLPRAIATPPPAQIAVPPEIVAATPLEAPPPPAASVPVAAAPLPVPTPAPAAQPPLAPAAPVQAVTPARFDAAYLDNPKPGYPPISRRLGEEGRVVLQVRVDAAGLAVEAQVHASSGFDRLDQAALSTVRRWKFVPARRGSEAIAATVLVPITFSLKG